MNDPALNSYPQPLTSAARFGLRELLGIVTVVAICLGVSVRLPALGIVAGVVLTPAWMRASLAMRRLRELGGLPTSRHYLAWMLHSAGVFLGLYLAALFAFICSFWAGFFIVALPAESLGFGRESTTYGIGAGYVFALAGLGVTLWFARRWFAIRVVLAPQEHRRHG